MTPQHHLPADIERTSLSIITAELDAMGLTPPPETAAVVKRVIHTTADFDYARNLRFTPGAVAAGGGGVHSPSAHGRAGRHCKPLRPSLPTPTWRFPALQSRALRGWAAQRCATWQTRR